MCSVYGVDVTRVVDLLSALSWSMVAQPFYVEVCMVYEQVNGDGVGDVKVIGPELVFIHSSSLLSWSLQHLVERHHLYHQLVS